MVTYEDIESNGRIKRNFTLIEGDTFSGSVMIKDKDNTEISTDLIKSLKFKIGHKDFDLIYESDFVYNEDIGKWYISIPSEKTREIGKGRYIYEYELTMADGFVTTIMQANFKITNELGEI